MKKTDEVLAFLAPLFDEFRLLGISPEFRQTKHTFVVQLTKRHRSVTIAWKKGTEVPDVCSMPSLLKV